MTVQVSSDAKLETIELTSPPSVEEGDTVIALSRDFYTCRLSESSGTIHTNYPYFGCELLGSSNYVGTEVCEGGPLITKMVHVCGINFFDGYQGVHPLRTSEILTCLENWSTNCIVRQSLFGMTVTDAAELPTYALKKVARVRGDGSAVIKEVYEGSPADIAGVRSGDLVLTLTSQGSYHDLLRDLSRGLARPLNEISYALALTSLSRELNADSTRDILVFVRKNGSDRERMVRALNLSVDDERFCSSWLGDESEWYGEPLFGS